MARVAHDSHVDQQTTVRAWGRGFSQICRPRIRFFLKGAAILPGKAAPIQATELDQPDYSEQIAISIRDQRFPLRPVLREEVKNLTHKII